MSKEQELLAAAEKIEDKLWQLAEEFEELDFTEYIEAGNGINAHGVVPEICGAAESVHILVCEYEKWKEQRRQ